MPCRDLPRQAVQLDLFRPANGEPDWWGLPLEVREQARQLLIQLLWMSPVPSGAVEGERAASDE